MAVDRPGDYPGNHGGAYVDQSGMTRQFTYIDHDIKPKMSNYMPEETIEQLNENRKQYRNDLIERILSLPAVYCSPVFQDGFTTRGDKDVVEWNAPMLRDNGIPTERLSSIYTLSSKRQEFIIKGITP